MTSTRVQCVKIKIILFHRRDTTAMLLRSISNIFNVNKRHICKTANKALFDSGRQQIRQLSSADAKETAAIDPLNYKIETHQGLFEDHGGKSKEGDQIR